MNYKKIGPIFFKVLLLVCVVSLAGFIAYKNITVDPPGYCRAQDRYIPDEEYLRTAIALFEWDMNRERPIYPEMVVKRRRDYNEKGYQFWEQTRDRSDCCKVSRIDTNKIIKRMFDGQEVLVTLYTGKSRGDSQAWFHFDVCGNLIPKDLSFLGSGIRGVTTRNYPKPIDSN